MSGTPVKNLRMFRELCGESSLKNVVIVTNMWEGIDRQVGERRQIELMSKANFFEPLLRGGGRMARHENAVASAQEILRLVLYNRPLPLRIQEELVDEKKDITETGAGEEVNRELNAQIKKHKEEMNALKEQMKQAIKDKDEETRRELGEECKWMQDEVERLENDAKRMASDYWREKQEMEDRLRQMEEAKQREHRLRIIHTVANAVVGIVAPVVAPVVQDVARAAVPTVKGVAGAAVPAVTRAIGFISDGVSLVAHTCYKLW